MKSTNADIEIRVKLKNFFTENKLATGLHYQLLLHFQKCQVPLFIKKGKYRKISLKVPFILICQGL
jgi:hypothetical protein